MEQDYDEILLLEEDATPVLTEAECATFHPVIKNFVEYYVAHKDEPVQKWLSQELQESLPEKTTDEIQAMTREIISTLELNETKKASLAEAVSEGRSKESWFASEVKEVTAAMSGQEAAGYLAGLDQTVQTANQSLHKTITTKAGAVSQNPHLDGLIAEQYHAQTFNLNAEAAGSPYRAEVLVPKDGVYTKNSVDIVIKDGSGKIVKRYQAKYYKDAKATERAFEQGDYRGQQKLVPEGQQEAITKKSTTVLEAPDGTTSNPLTKETAEQMRDEAQNGNWNDLNWNEYKVKDLAMGIGKQVGYAALQGAAIGAGFDIAGKLLSGEEIKGEDVVEAALTNGADFGVKAAAAGAIKVGVEKGFISVIPKGTPASTIANIAFVAVEDAKIVGAVIAGDLSLNEGIDKLEQTTVSAAAGLLAMGKGAALGASLGAVLGPVGVAVGGFVGGAVGYMAGAKVGEAVVKGAQKVRDVVVEGIKVIGSGLCEAKNALVDGIRNKARRFLRI